MLTSVSLIATTYNQSADLDLYLKSLVMQSDQNFELVLADDGSKSDTREVIERYRPHFGERLVHVWHEDLGYRKCKILNEAIRRSQGEWLIFTDSDLVVHPRFVEDHLALAVANTCVMGRRVDLGPSVSQWVREHADCLFSEEFYRRVVTSALWGESKGLKRIFRITAPVVRWALDCDSVPDLLGSNFSVDRNLLMRVNGFDEALEHYWGEDGDLFVRLRNAGARFLGRKSYAVQFHLWHPLRAPQPRAQEAYQQSLQNFSYLRCEQGLEQGK